jgi:isochorismate pyruvate lyase
MKEPEDCQNIEEIRNEINKLDREIINLIGKRFAYVKTPAKFKISKADVKASERF